MYEYGNFWCTPFVVYHVASGNNRLQIVFVQLLWGSISAKFVENSQYCAEHFTYFHIDILFTGYFVFNRFSMFLTKFFYLSKPNFSLNHSHVFFSILVYISNPVAKKNHTHTFSSHPISISILYDRICCFFFLVFVCIMLFLCVKIFKNRQKTT